MTLVLQLPEAIDALTRRDIRYRALDAVARGERAIVLDAADTASVDVTGVGMLINVHRVVRAFGGRVVLAGVTEPVRAALALAGADHLLEVAPTVEAAQAATAQTASRA
jgi:anti-anti-sigma factor